MNLRRSFLFVPIILITLSFSCKSPSGPDVPKNPREYTWTIDTLAYPGSFQTTMRDIWASSPSDVYVVGHNSDGFGKMYHFDGKTWKPVGLNPIEGGTIAGPIDLSGIYGFGQNNIFAVGKHIYDNPNPPPNFLDSSLIIHFNGQQWTEQKIKGGRFFTAIGGTSPSNVWAVGVTNILFHYNETLWKPDSVPVKIQADGFFQINALNENPSGEVFAIGNTYYNSLAKNVYYFFLKRSQVWTVVDSFVVQPGQIETKWGYGDLWVSPSGTLYSCGRFCSTRAS
ncbi:MAG: hypothetical protein HY276_12100 [Ignavibacteriales bacterium]|nr:hypothetical protein [Ignavibacteriales bacterium]